MQACSLHRFRTFAEALRPLHPGANIHMASRAKFLDAQTERDKHGHTISMTQQMMMMMTMMMMMNMKMKMKVK